MCHADESLTKISRKQKSFHTARHCRAPLQASPQVLLFENRNLKAEARKKSEIRIQRE
jgi:hypothetical protein